MIALFLDRATRDCKARGEGVEKDVELIKLLAKWGEGRVTVGYGVLSATISPASPFDHATGNIARRLAERGSAVGIFATPDRGVDAG